MGRGKKGRAEGQEGGREGGRGREALHHLIQSLLQERQPMHELIELLVLGQFRRFSSRFDSFLLVIMTLVKVKAFGCRVG